MTRLTLKIGRGELTFEHADPKMIHRFSAVYGMLPEKCDACKSENVYLSFKNPKGNDYYLIACKDCGAELTFHQKKEGGFYLVQGEKMTVYQGGNDQTAEQQQQSPQQASGQAPQQQTTQNVQNTFGGDDIPF